MAKKVYFGAGNKARRCRRIYVGVGDTARLVTHGYIGVNGIAREFWSGGVLEYEGAAPDMACKRYQGTSASLDGYALIGGGEYNNAGVVDIYSPSLIHTSATLLTNEGRSAATTIGNHAIFAGSKYNASDNKADVIDGNFCAYTRLTLTRTMLRASATTVGNWALIIGAGTINCISSQLIVGTPVTSSLVNYSGGAAPAAVTIGDYAVFAGFYSSGSSGAVNTVIAYSSALVATSPARLSEARTEIGAAANGEFALFAGGRYDNYTQERIGRTVDVYDANLTKRQNLSLKSGRENIAAASANGYFLFACGNVNGGISSSYSASADVDGFDSTLTAIDLPASERRERYTAAVAGDYILVAGGAPSNGGHPQQTVFAYCT